ncbi:hypothetical protein DFH09DRAFT_1444738 [Mycena vulgaris]|nr:hypothetical protein DFH09DRAFT_1444738 [Mycena vulgaris]
MDVGFGNRRRESAQAFLASECELGVEVAGEIVVEGNRRITVVRSDALAIGNPRKEITVRASPRTADEACESIQDQPRIRAEFLNESFAATNFYGGCSLNQNSRAIDKEERAEREVKGDKTDGDETKDTQTKAGHFSSESRGGFYMTESLVAAAQIACFEENQGSPGQVAVFVLGWCPVRLPPLHSRVDTRDTQQLRKVRDKNEITRAEEVFGDSNPRRAHNSKNLELWMDGARCALRPLLPSIPTRIRDLEIGIKRRARGSHFECLRVPLEWNANTVLETCMGQRGRHWALESLDQKPAEVVETMRHARRTLEIHLMPY